MKSKLLYLIIAIFLVVFNLSAQTNIPTGKVKLIEFTNETSSFSIPEGKSWVIYNVFSDHTTDGVVKYDEDEMKNVLQNALQIRIFIKDLNGLEKTNLSKNMYGLQLYNTLSSSRTIFYPLLFPEKTSFSLVIVKGNLGSEQMYNGKGYISLVEIDN